MSLKVNASAISNYCRLCADIKPNFDLIDTIYTDLDIREKIYTLFQIEIKPDDLDFPKTVCSECFDKVISCFEFNETVKKAQETLRQLVALNQPVKIEDNSNDNLDKSGDKLLLDDTFSEVKYADDIKNEDLDVKEFLDDINDSNSDSSSKNKRSYKKKKSGRKTKTKSSTKNKESTKKNCNDSKDKKATVFSREVWGNYKLKCNDCTEDIVSVKHLREHYAEVHKKPPVYVCSECSRVYQQKQFRSFYIHISRHFNKNYSNRCNICGKSWFKKETYERHIKTHSDDEKPQCKECGKTFKSAKYLQIHARVHLPDEHKPKFTCTICNKSFVTIYSLTYHTRAHTGERPLAYCDQCGKSFSSKLNVEIHKETVHTEERNFHCEQCSRSFKCARHLQKHIRMHQGIRPYRCEVCSRTFSAKSNLNNHLYIHSTVFAFECTFCQKRFQRAQFLKNHMRQHTGEKPYSCDKCDHYFTNSANYIKHMKRRHGVLSVAKDPMKRHISKWEFNVPSTNNQQSTHPVNPAENKQPSSLV